MTDFDREEIIRHNRVARLLWFGIGFVLALVLMKLVSVV